MRTSDQVDQLQDALSKAQGVIKPAAKNATNPHLRNKFADLASCWDALRDALSSNGLSVSQGSKYDDSGRLVMVTRLGHSSGQWLETDTPIKMAEQKGLNPMQSLGVALTYARRYGLGAATGLVTDDDTDGHGADTKATPKSAAKPSLISDAQRKRLFAMSKKSCLDNNQMKAMLKGYGYESSNDILKKDYEAICREVEAEGSEDGRFAEPPPEQH